MKQKYYNLYNKSSNEYACYIAELHLGDTNINRATKMQQSDMSSVLLKKPAFARRCLSPPSVIMALMIPNFKAKLAHKIPKNGGVRLLR